MLGKIELLEAIASTNRGISASPETKQAILAAIVQLEERNPTREPTAAGELLEGDWALLYTTSQELLGINQVPLIQLGRIYQCIRVNQGKVYNIAEIDGIRYLEGVVSVAARFTPTSEKRLQVRFERLVVGLQSFLGYDGVEPFVERLAANERFWGVDLMLGGDRDRSQEAGTVQGETQGGDRRGWIDLTYLDADLRINRGNAGSVFVLKRVNRLVQ